MLPAESRRGQRGGVAARPHLADGHRTRQCPRRASGRKRALPLLTGGCPVAGRGDLCPTSSECPFVKTSPVATRLQSARPDREAGWYLTEGRVSRCAVI